jgi:hypothetical protein
VPWGSSRSGKNQSKTNTPGDQHRKKNEERARARQKLEAQERKRAIENQKRMRDEAKRKKR